MTEQFSKHGGTEVLKRAGYTVEQFGGMALLQTGPPPERHEAPHSWFVEFYLWVDTLGIPAYEATSVLHVYEAWWADARRRIAREKARVLSGGPAGSGPAT